MDGEEADITVWSHALGSVMHGLQSGKRLFVEEAARKVKMLLASSAATERSNIVQVH